MQSCINKKIMAEVHKINARAQQMSGLLEKIGADISNRARWQNPEKLTLWDGLEVEKTTTTHI